MAISEPFDFAEAERLRIVVKPPRFCTEFIENLKFNPNDEWLIKHLIPRRGLGLLFGAKHSFKSFLAYHIAVCITNGLQWGEKKTHQAHVVYIAAEGGGGLPKRAMAYERKGYVLSPKTFALIRAAPNLGANTEDRGELIRAIDSAGIKPGIVIIDTLAASIAGANENGDGMLMLVSNGLALAAHFDCVVLFVHHVGNSDDAKKRARGHSSLPGAADFQILTERPQRELRATLTLMTAREDQDGVSFEAGLSRVVLGVDDEGDEVSTLIVETISTAGPEPSSGGQVSEVELIKRAIVDAYSRLADNLEASPGFNGQPVRRVSIDDIRAEVKSRGWLDTDDAGHVTPLGRQYFRRAKHELFGSQGYLEAEGLFWRP